MQTNSSTTTAYGRMLVVTGLFVVMLTSNGWAQSCCNSGAMGQPMIIGEAAPELSDYVDPMRVINLTIVVDPKAKVVVNGEPTYTEGTVRQYIVRDVEPGRKYQFVVIGTYVNEFEAVYQGKAVVNVSAGSSERVVINLRRVKRPPPVPVIPVLPMVQAPAAAAVR